MPASATSADLADFYAEQGGVQLKCGVGKSLAALPPEDNARLRLALETPDIQNKAVSAWLKKRGQDVGDQAVSRHRRGECKCQPTS